MLKVISRSAFDLQAVFDTLIASAVELSGSHSGAICVRDGEIFRYRSSSGSGASSELHNYLVEHPANPGADPSSDARFCPDKLSKFRTFVRTRNIRFR